MLSLSQLHSPVFVWVCSEYRPLLDPWIHWHPTNKRSTLITELWFLSMHSVSVT